MTSIWHTSPTSERYSAMTGDKTFSSSSRAKMQVMPSGSWAASSERVSHVPVSVNLPSPPAAFHCSLNRVTKSAAVSENDAAPSSCRNAIGARVGLIVGAALCVGCAVFGVVVLPGSINPFGSPQATSDATSRMIKMTFCRFLFIVSPMIVRVRLPV